MAGNRRRKQDNSGVHAFLYVLVVLVLLCGMGYLFYYSRSQANERQEYIRELESKEAATRDVVQVTVPEEPESETQTESETETQTQTETELVTESESQTQSESEAQSETVSASEAETDEVTSYQTNSWNSRDAVNSSESSESLLGVGENTIIILNGTGKSGVAAYWKRLLGTKGLKNVVMADYKGTVEDSTVIYVREGVEVPQGVKDRFPDAEYRDGSLEDADTDAEQNVRVATGQTEYDSYDMWIVVGKDDALHD